MAWDLTAEITQQQTDAELTFCDTAVISRLTETSDGQGGQIQSWTAHGTVPCRLVANTGDSKQIGSQFNRRGDFTLTVAHDADIQESDRVTVDSINYRVLFVDETRDWRTATRAQVNEEIA